jgi:hypothetical protein
MRTTVTIDPDVEVLLKTVMRERRMTFKEALNSALRAGLRPGAQRRPRKFHQQTFRMGFRPEIAMNKALSLAAASEDEEMLRKLSLRK